MSHRQLNERDRFYIEQRLAEGDSHGKIARSLGVHRTTILREIERHTPINFNNVYCYRLASSMARDKRSLAKKGVAFRDIKEQTKEFIHTRLSTHTSPDVISGEPDHRDVVLSDAERASGKVMQICVSRARSARLVLDL